MPGRGKKTDRFRECIRLCRRPFGDPPSVTEFEDGKANFFGVEAADEGGESAHCLEYDVDNGEGRVGVLG